MPSTVIWSGATSGDMDVNGNYVGGTKPASGDSVIFDRGSVAVTAWTPVALADVTVTQGYSGTIGTSGSPLAMTEGITGTLKVGGKQTGFYLSVPTTKTIATAIFETGSSSISGAGTLTTAYVSGGATLNASVTALTNLNVITPDSSAIIATSATSVTTTYTMGRVESTSRTLAAVTVAPQGRVVTKGTTATTSVTIEPGGVFNKQSGSTDAAVTIKYGGLFSNDGNTYISPAPTITGLTIWSGGKIIPTGVGNTLTIGTTTYIGAAGGDRPFDPIG